MDMRTADAAPQLRQGRTPLLRSRQGNCRKVRRERPSGIPQKQVDALEAGGNRWQRCTATAASPCARPCPPNS